jgi:hypothetical protein
MIESAKASVQVRGSVDAEKFKAARAFGGSDVKFEVRAMRPAAPGQRAIACLVCIVCLICIVCSVATGEAMGIKELPPVTPKP